MWHTIFMCSALRYVHVHVLASEFWQYSWVAHGAVWWRDPEAGSCIRGGNDGEPALGAVVSESAGRPVSLHCALFHPTPHVGFKRAVLLV